MSSTEQESPRVNFGRNKGRLVAELSDADLMWLAGRLRADVSNPSLAHWREKNEADLSDCEREQRARFQ